jgi:hypothetical protein
MPVGHICLNNLLKQNGYVYPYVGIIQIRLWVRDAPPVLSLPAQAPLLSILIYSTLHTFASGYYLLNIKSPDLII